MQSLLRNHLYRNLLLGNISRLEKLYLPRNFATLCLALSSLYFVVTGVQYWGASYLTISLGRFLVTILIDWLRVYSVGVSPLTVNALFIFCAATAPTSGVFFGGWFVDMYVGGYRGKIQRTSTLEISCVFGRLAVYCSHAG